LRTLSVFCPNELDATSFYRGMGPMGLLKKQMGDIIINLMRDVNWSYLSMVDMVFLQRPCLPAHLTIVKYAKRLGIPVWVDFDDALFHVPNWNPFHSVYSQPDRMKATAEIIATADVVSVSTPHLAGLYQELNKNIVVIPNAFNDEFFKYEPPSPEKKKLICWRGSQTHREDLNIASEAVTDLAVKYPEVTWMFIGDNPWFTSYMPDKSAIVVPALDPIEYFEFIKKTAPTIQIAPLVDNDFNRAKSNIAWLEATYSGAVTLAPNWGEWYRPGITNYTDRADFKVKLEGLICGANFNSLQAASWLYIKNELMLSNVNQKRIDIINQYLPGK
jgi:hypothetical protein